MPGERAQRPIWVWRIPNSYPQLDVGTYDRDQSTDPLLFRRGDTVLAAGTPIRVVVLYDREPEKLVRWDVLANTERLPLVGARVTELLARHAASDYQLVEATVRARGQELSQFKLLNVVRRVAAVDLGRSIYRALPGTSAVLSFSKRVYREDPLSGFAMARDEAFLPEILVSDSLKVAFRRAAISGVKFVSPHDV